MDFLNKYNNYHRKLNHSASAQNAPGLQFVDGRWDFGKFKTSQQPGLCNPLWQFPRFSSLGYLESLAKDNWQLSKVEAVEVVELDNFHSAHLISSSPQASPLVLCDGLSWWEMPAPAVLLFQAKKLFPQHPPTARGTCIQIGIFLRASILGGQTCTLGWPLLWWREAWPISSVSQTDPLLCIAETARLCHLPKIDILGNSVYCPTKFTFTFIIADSATVGSPTSIAKEDNRAQI